MIHLQNVSKVYRTANGPLSALSEVTLDIEPGEFVAVRGPSGCGKSTLLAVIGGLGTPSAGHVRVAGEELLGMSPASLARFRAQKIGFVFQMFHLLPYLNVWENVLAATLPGEHAAASNRAEDLLGQFALTERLRHRPGELSAGERQRVAIARALVNRPPLLLADEPTGNLDPDSASAVLAMLADFHDQGGTVVLVTHQEQAAAAAGRTISLREGQIADPCESK